MKVKIFDKTLVATSIICLLPMVLGLFMYGSLPDSVTIHWGADGQANGWADKSMAAFGLPGFLLLVNIITNIAINSDPKKQNSSKIMRLIGVWSIPVISIIVCSITLFSAIGAVNADILIPVIIPAMVGVLFIILGNYMPKCKQNYTVGIKLPWTLNDEDNWNKTHRLSGYLWMACGVVFIAASFARLYILILPIIAIMVLIPTGYSFFLYMKSKKT